MTGLLELMIIPCISDRVVGFIQRSFQPACVDCHDDHKKIKSQNQVNRLEDFNDPFGRTAVELVDAPAPPPDRIADTPLPEPVVEAPAPPVVPQREIRLEPPTPPEPIAETPLPAPVRKVEAATPPVEPEPTVSSLAFVQVASRRMSAEDAPILTV